MEITQHQKTAVVLGASGLVGGHCLQQLLGHSAYGKVVSLGRRKLGFAHPKLSQEIVDFMRLEDFAPLFEGQDVFSCLGTTMAKAGSKAAFYEVDFTYAYETARLAREAGANQLLLVSSVGADADSLFYYSRVKGELETAVKELGYWGLHIFRPSLLLGERKEKRLAEQLAVRLSRGIAPLMQRTALSPYSPIEAQDVAQAMVRTAQRLEPGAFVYDSGTIYNLAHA